MSGNSRSVRDAAGRVRTETWREWARGLASFSAGRTHASTARDRSSAFPLTHQTGFRASENLLSRFLLELLPAIDHAPPALGGMIPQNLKPKNWTEQQDVRTNQSMKTRKSLLTTPTATALGATALLLAGCGSTSGYKQADKTGAGIAEYREEILAGKTAIDATMKSLGDIAASANTNPRKAFELFSKDVKNLESIAAKIRKRAESMKEQGQNYFSRWE